MHNLKFAIRNQENYMTKITATTKFAQMDLNKLFVQTIGDVDLSLKMGKKSTKATFGKSYKWQSMKTLTQSKQKNCIHLMVNQLIHLDKINKVCPF